MTYDLAPEDPTPQPAPRDPLAKPKPAVDESAHVDVETRCNECGYIIFGVDRRGRCPECGTPIQLSMAGDLLMHASPAWLRQMRSGLALLVWSVVVFISAVVIELSTLSVGGLIRIAAALMGLLGTYKLTSREPREVSMIGNRLSVSQGLRLGAVIRAITSAVLMGRLVGMSLTLVAIALTIDAVVCVLLMIGICVHLRRLAARTDDIELERRTIVLGWITVGSAGIIVVCYPLGTLLSGVSGAPPACAGLMALIALVACAFVFLRLMSRYHYLFKWAAHEAEVLRDHED
jgi:hypothetical protein